MTGSFYLRFTSIGSNIISVLLIEWKEYHFIHYFNPKFIKVKFCPT